MFRRNFSKFYLLVGLIAAVVLLIFLNYLGWLDWPKRIFSKAVIPILKPFEAVGHKTSGALSVLFNIKSIIRENSELRRENQELILKISGLTEMAQENKILRQQLQIELPLESKIVQADLIGFDSGNVGQYFLIGEGSGVGVKENQGVIMPGGFLVGKVVGTENNFSKVMELTDSNSSVFALTQETRVGGVVRGDHGVGLVLDMIPPEKEIKPQELIVSSGLDGFIPKGLFIGQVDVKISTESEVFQRFKVKPAVNYNDIETVFVILGNR
ncbi:MAG: rod shape-determining protein MreC [Candidatus Portnoybacteria bacterium RBG_19FT_COMBO_36_7]|uniref:Cell shape-determining protein MreC n=1 Tax=Candidatus Portnoybacteria bacterium RBG_19FT_COMBO_36_7 TaxID=1801992 RepID=A0A1G2F9Z2_9BACT|nr:MAG: rod shape-determining protein MreC [Candidatus Portnoybacteria bacterium RBG_19FT_COMBO_36_7]